MPEFFYAAGQLALIVYDATVAVGHGAGKLLLLLVGGVVALVLIVIAKLRG